MSARDAAYLEALARAHLLAPEDSVEEDWAGLAFAHAADRLGSDVDALLDCESERLREEGLLS